MPGEEPVLLSADSIAPGDDSAANHPVGFLNSLSLSGLPLHKIKLKVGAVVMLLRNLDPRSGLCNGNRLIITAIHAHLLEGAIITGEYIGLKTASKRPTGALSPTDVALFPTSPCTAEGCLKEASHTPGTLPTGVCPGNPLCGLSARSAALY